MDFRDMYEHFYQRVYYTALKVTRDACAAEDILQETFMKAHEKWEEIRDQGKAGAWLATIAHRKAIDYLRKEKRTQVVPLEEALTQPSKESPFSEVEHTCVLHQMEEGIRKRVSLLSPKLRDVFQLHVTRQMSEGEIAQELNISLSAAKSRLHRARKAVKGKMTEEWNFGEIA
ncbi:RNA polymerase sigma factor [Halobacillus sp. KGW1]|uniref:RNA polymerase sigma factor n=1 Tax=Halobacillus sp. KGW1 TaxID=1793726 RepID=UPI0007861572|nr:RNA polymerase sigma factor [Halobacillus sp. KGW1]